MEGLGTSMTSWMGHTVGTGITSILAVLGLVSRDSWNPPNLEDYIRQHGYPVEAHEITTADGYILTYHRIPYGKGQFHSNVKRKPVFLQHGILQSSADWVLLPSSLGYLLADEGFDVWMGNARGNTYSRRHVSLNPDKDKKEFWDFSWHEMGYYDLPAAIDYILEVTRQDQLLYSGFSMGTTMFFVLGATRPEYMPKVQAAVLMAPVAYPWHIPSPIIEFATKISFTFQPRFLKETYEFFPLSSSIEWLYDTFCDMWLVKMLRVCEDFLKLVAGFHLKNIERDVHFLVKYLPNVRKVREVPEPIFNHMDFCYAIDAKTLLYDDIVAIFSNFSDIATPGVWSHFINKGYQQGYHNKGYYKGYHNRGYNNGYHNKGYHKGYQWKQSFVG